MIEGTRKFRIVLYGDVPPTFPGEELVVKDWMLENLSWSAKFNLIVRGLEIDVADTMPPPPQGLRQ